MIKALFPSLKELSLQIAKERIREAQIAEDADFVVINEKEPEMAPICKIEEELRQYLRTCVISRKITHLFIHCTATQQTATVSSIQNYWRNVLGWKNPGYNIMLPKEGFTVLADFNTICNGVRGYNSHGIHISYIGGIDSNGKPIDNRTVSQKRLIEIFVEEMVERFPDIKVVGHNEASKKACPCFKVENEYPEYWTGI